MGGSNSKKEKTPKKGSKKALEEDTKSKPSQKSSGSASPRKIEAVREDEIETVVAPAAAAEPPTGSAPKRTATTATGEPKNAKLFAAPEGPKKSKIFNALNPEKLWYETRREKEESKDDVVQISIRGGGTGMTRSSVDFALERDDEGNFVEQELEGVQEQPEEPYDPNNLPDFGEFQAEMNEMRAKRAAEHQKRQDELRRKFMEKKAAEEAVRQAELKEIMEREEKLKQSKASYVSNEFVEEVQHRLDQEAQQNYRTFSFKAD